MCIILSSSSNQKQNLSFSLFTFLFPHSKVAGKYVFIIERSKNVVIIKLCKYECKRKFLHEIYRQAGKKKKRFHAYKKISTNKARSLHLHNFHTSLGALGIQC